MSEHRDHPDYANEHNEYEVRADAAARKKFIANLEREHGPIRNDEELKRVLMLRAVANDQKVPAGFRSHAKELLAGRDPTGGMVSLEAQLDMLRDHLSEAVR